MRKLYLILFINSILLSCDKDSQPDILGTWHLTEVLSDPGDGSGTFQVVESNKTITFYKNGTVTSNGSLCSHYSETLASSEGTFSSREITAPCDSFEIEIEFRLEGSELILFYPCFEPCQAKYTRIETGE